MVTSLVGAGLLNPVVNSSGYLARIYSNQNRVLVGIDFELLAAPVSVTVICSERGGVNRLVEVRAFRLKSGHLAFPTQSGPAEAKF